MRNFILTEEQYKRAMEEGVLPNTPQTKTVVDGKGSSNVGAAVNQAAQNANTDTIEVVNFGKGNSSGESSGSVFESSMFITKKDLQERRLKRMRENSQIFSINDIL